MKLFCPDKKNGFRNFVMSVMVELGVHKKGDPLDPDGLKAKLVFGITQLIYTLITISPVGTKYSAIAQDCTKYTVVLNLHNFID